MNVFDQDKEFLQDRDLLELAHRVRRLPDHEPPADLTAAIMGRIDPCPGLIFPRLRQWLLRPRTFTITPMRLVPALALGAAMLVIAPWIWSLSPQAPAPVSDARHMSIVFTLAAQDARSVALIGSFNRWDPSGFEMRRTPLDNVWVIEVPLPPGRHEYAFLVNEENVVADPDATFTKSDGFGNRNSVILVNNETQI